MGVDGSDPSRAALRWSAEEASLRGDSLEVVTGWHYPLYEAGGFGAPSVAPVNPDDLEGAAWEVLERVVKEEAVDDGSIELRLSVVKGSSARRLMDAANGAELLVVGSRGHGGFASLLLGSVSQQCATHATCPIVVIREPQPARIGGRMVVGVDGSEGSQRALGWGIQEASRRDAVLELVNAWTYPAIVGYVPAPLDGFPEWSAEVVAKAIDDVRTRAPSVPAEGKTLQSPAARALIEVSQEADLLIVGSRGHGGFAGLLLGSVGLECLHHAHCSVAIVRPAVEEAGA